MGIINKLITGGYHLVGLISLIPTCPIEQMHTDAVSNMILSEITWGVRKCSPCTLWQQTCLANHMLQDVDSKCCTSVRLPKGNHCERLKIAKLRIPGNSWNVATRCYISSENSKHLMCWAESGSRRTRFCLLYGLVRPLVDWQARAARLRR